MHDKLFTIFTLNFYDYLFDKYFINLCNTCKELSNLLDETLYYNLLLRKFSKKFVLNARSIIISWKNCYSLIIQFELKVMKYNFPRIRNLPNKVNCEDDYGKFKVRLFPIICSTSSQTFTLREHADAGWFTIEECSNLKWSAADIPVIENYVLKGGSDELLVGKS